MKSEVLNISCSPVKHENFQIISNTSTTARTNEVLVSSSNEKYRYMTASLYSLMLPT